MCSNVEPGAAGHEPSVVPEHLAPRLGVALDVDGERRTLDDDLALGDPRADRLEVRPQRDGLAVRDRQAAEREVDHDAARCGGAGTCTGARRSSARR